MDPSRSVDATVKVNNKRNESVVLGKCKGIRGASSIGPCTTGGYPTGDHPAGAFLPLPMTHALDHDHNTQKNEPPPRAIS